MTHNKSPTQRLSSTNGLNKLKNAGFTLIELILVLGLIAVIGTATVMLYVYVGDKSEVTKNVTQAQRITQGFNSAYANSGAFEPDLTLEKAINSGAITPDLLTGGKLKDASGRNITLSSVSINGVSGGAIQLVYSSMKPRICTQFLSAIASSFNDVKVNNVSLTAVSGDQDSGGQTSSISPTTISQACNTENPNVSLVYWASNVGEDPADEALPSGISGVDPGTDPIPMAPLVPPPLGSPVVPAVPATTIPNYGPGGVPSYTEPVPAPGGVGAPPPSPPTGPPVVSEITPDYGYYI